MRLYQKKPKDYSHCKQGWKTVGRRKCYFRSDWEYQFCLALDLLKCKGEIRDWEYEPKTFWFLEIKRGVRSYKPDFRVTRNDGSQYWIEVKGHMDDKSKTKLKRFKKYYPNEQLQLIQQDWFMRNRAALYSLMASDSIGLSAGLDSNNF